jgi:hypothetical protein
MDAMDASHAKNQIRRVLFIWGVLTLLYFFSNRKTRLHDSGVVKLAHP